MDHGQLIYTSREEAEYYFQELTAQQLRARQLFSCYLEENPLEEADEDYYYAYYDESAR